MSEMLSRTLGEQIEMEMTVADDAWPVWTDPTQLESAILNLAVNARDAMPLGGRLTISAENRTIAQSTTAGRGTLSPGDYIVITVSDTGAGIPEHVIERLLEPFFRSEEHTSELQSLMRTSY